MSDTPKVETTEYDNLDFSQVESLKERRDLILTHKEAQAGSPDDMAACGEEDIGAGLEFLVTKDDHKK
ncbi:hypothetical protein [Methylophaga sp.]|uniref:hypothetical protein n=1 Tax=Methylophaga sp. TaxID=2024840 RepID=UPI003A947876